MSADRQQREEISVGTRVSFPYGGSRRTGGYGHGRAIDITSADGNNAEVVWEWIDKHGGEYGLRRPMPGPDPAHIQQTSDTHKIVFALHNKRIKSASKMRRRHAGGAKKIKLARAR